MFGHSPSDVNQNTIITNWNLFVVAVMKNPALQNKPRLQKLYSDGE